MSGRGGRDRFRGRDNNNNNYSSRSEEKSRHGKNSNPPSRHLWVGNLSHHISESELSEHFLRFGELDSIAFQPGRSYAFVNFRRDEDALIAVRALQGFELAGLPLNIEFAKAERSTTSSRDEDYSKRRVERFSAERDGGSFFQRDSRGRPPSLEPSFPDKNAEPSEVLWIGFPAFLNVDEIMLRRAFSPFGDVVKITAFPGRSYAFVRFRTIPAARRAREALQGKLFNNPRVAISFAKSELDQTEESRNTVDIFSNFNTSDNYRQDLLFQPHIRSPHFTSDMEYVDSGSLGFGRNSSARQGESRVFEQMGLLGPGSQFGLSDNTYKLQRDTPTRESYHPRDFSPERFSRNFAPFDEPSDFRDDSFPFQEPKRMKMGMFPSDTELPDYPFSGLGHDGQFAGLPHKFNSFPEFDSYNRSVVPGESFRMNMSLPHEDRDDDWKVPLERFETGSGSLHLNPVKRKTFTPESHRPSLSEEWKWEGTIAKGGTPVCRARCFPKGKVLDFMLPDVLDCTARTSLDMLSKHFYQAASSWVVFFAPETDDDITFYNEFMHYLGEKQRAAVAKLSEKATLFLVPPSDFSEKVLKVPGKLSISGVILKFEEANSSFSSSHHQLETTDSKVTPFHENVSFASRTSSEIRTPARSQNQNYINSSSEASRSLTSLPTPRKPENRELSYMGNIPRPAPSISNSGSASLPGRSSEFLDDSTYYDPFQPQSSSIPSSWSSHITQNSNTGPGNLPPNISNNPSVHSSDNTTTHHQSMKPRVSEETSSSQYTPGNFDTRSYGAGNFSHQERKSDVSSSLTAPSLQAEHLARLASLLGQRQQQTNGGSGLSLEEEQKHLGPISQPRLAFGSLQQPGLQNQGSPYNPPSAQFNQVHQMMPTSNAPSTQSNRFEPSREVPQSQGNPSFQNNPGAQEETEADPQKRLQATLQLAAALLQQIQQQGKGPDQH